MIAACPFPTRQGMQVLIKQLATTLARAGHEVHLITYGYGDYEEDVEFHHHRASRLHTGVGNGQHILKPAADAALLMTAARVVKAHACDVLHVHNVEGLGIGALLKLQVSLPLVFHSHTAMGPELPRYFKQHTAQAFASVVGDVLDRILPRVADAVITTDLDHCALHRDHGVQEERLFVIPPGVNFQALQQLNPAHVQQKPPLRADYTRALEGFRIQNHLNAYEAVYARVLGARL